MHGVQRELVATATSKKSHLFLSIVSSAFDQYCKALVSKATTGMAVLRFCQWKHLGPSFYLHPAPVGQGGFLQWEALVCSSGLASG